MSSMKVFAICFGMSVGKDFEQQELVAQRFAQVLASL